LYFRMNSKAKEPRLLAGPILVRECLTTPRQPRFYALRASYVGLHFVLLWTAWQSLVGFEKDPSLGETARFAAQAFELLSLTQLAVILFFAAVAGAGVVAVEKEKRTFVLLLATRMTSAEIVVDKFLCAVLRTWSMLAAALPAFFFLALLGGVSFGRIAETAAATAGGALVCAALGVLMGAWRETAFQALALTLAGVALGLIGAEGLGFVRVAGDKSDGASLEYWRACVSPVRAVFDAVSATTERAAAPAAVVNLLLGGAAAVLLLAVAAWKLRSWNPRGEPVVRREAAEAPAPAARSRSSRRVWDNPILWREVRTRAYGTRPILVKAAFLAISAALFLLLWMQSPGGDSDSPAFAVAAAVAPAAVLGLLLLNAQSLASVTTERDLKALDLILATDLRPSEFVLGKLLGAFYNAKEMVAAPIAMLLAAAAFGWIGLLGFVLSTAAFLVIAAFAVVLGVHAALRYETTPLATANSLGTMFLLFVGVLVCLYLIVISGRFEAQWASFVVFIVLGSIGLWISLSANHPTSAITLAAATTPAATFYCVLAFAVEDRVAPLLVLASAYGFATAAMLVPMLAEFDVATGRTTAAEG
jgi:hypothetical protein